MRLLKILLATTLLSFVMIDPAHASPSVSVHNSASFRRCDRISSANCADGSFLTFYISPAPTPVTNSETGYVESIYDQATGREFWIKLNECGGRKLRIVGVYGDANQAQINVYQQGSSGLGSGEPYGTCNIVDASDPAANFRNVTWEIQGSTPEFGTTNALYAGRLWYSTPSVYPSYVNAAPSGFHYIPGQDRRTDLSTCLVDPNQCPITTGGAFNQIIIYTSGMENDLCYEPCNPDTWRFQLVIGGTRIQLSPTEIWDYYTGYEEIRLALTGEVGTYTEYSLGQLDQHPQFLNRMPFISQSNYKFKFGPGN